MNKQYYEPKYSVCTDCGKVVNRHKRFLGSLHICLSKEELEEKKKELNNKNMNNKLQKLEEEIQEFANYFVERYFDIEDPEVWWVAKDVGGVLFVNDYFFDLQTMIDFVRYNYSEKEMFDYYDYALKKPKPNFNIKTYKKIRCK